MVVGRGVRVALTMGWLGLERGDVKLHLLYGPYRVLDAHRVLPPWFILA